MCSQNSNRKLWLSCNVFQVMDGQVRVLSRGRTLQHDLRCRFGTNVSDTLVTAALVIEPLPPALFASGKTPKGLFVDQKHYQTMTYHANFHFKAVPGGKEEVLRNTTIHGVPMWCLTDYRT